MTTKEIREKKTEALKHELADQQKHLFELRSQAVTEKLENPSQLKKTRKHIARMKTILREREIKDQKDRQSAPAPASTSESSEDKQA
jgi:large subunit ribosomal protein L29